MNQNIGWTAQSKHGWIHDEGMPGNTFTEDQLPHPDLQRLAGINPEQYRKQHGLFVEEGGGTRPEFVGTESGHSPAHVHESRSGHESFFSYTPEPVVEDEVSEDE